MGIVMTTPVSEVEKELTVASQRLQQAVLYNLAYVGERVRNAAVEKGSYKDRTGNLRSSVGYVIAVDGKVMQVGSFGGTNPAGQGPGEGESFAKSLVAQFPKGFALIVVAGMDYASFVSAKGYDVLDSAELLAEKLVPQMLRKLKIV